MKEGEKILLDVFFTEKDYRKIEIGEVFKSDDVYISAGFLVKCRLVDQICDEDDWDHYRET